MQSILFTSVRRLQGELQPPPCAVSKAAGAASSPAPSRPSSAVGFKDICKIQSSPPSRGATLFGRVLHDEHAISIHAPLTGRDGGHGRGRGGAGNFNPRAPHGARHTSSERVSDRTQFQSTRPSRGATSSSRLWSAICTLFQSTRPSRGATFRSCFLLIMLAKFQSTRPSRGATNTTPFSVKSFQFQSTRPSRGATLRFQRLYAAHHYFNPRAPHGARLFDAKAQRFPRGISIHAPLTGRDVIFVDEATQLTISIHAPLTGRDQDGRAEAKCLQHFNPRAPHGARRERLPIHPKHRLFQSTRPSRGATIGI